MIDSVVPACGGLDPTKAEVAARYAGGVQQLGRTVLSIAHATKAEALLYPFGSVFWHNFARATWSLANDKTGLVLTNRKHNNYQALGRFLVAAAWADDRLIEVTEKRSRGGRLVDRIADVLGADRSMTVAEIHAELDVDLAEDEAPTKADSVRKALQRASDSDSPRFVSTGAGASTEWRRP